MRDPRRLLLRLLATGLLLVVLLACWLSPLPLYLGLKPRRPIALPEIIYLTGWSELSRARVLHGEHREWHDRVVIAEVDMPEADADALLARLRQSYRSHRLLTGKLDGNDVERPPRWWKPTAESPQSTICFLTDTPSSTEPVWYGLSIAARARGQVRAYLLWDQQ